MNSFPAEAISHSRVLVVGDVMLDRYWFGEVERISPEAPVPVVRVARREDRLGGAANVARNVAALGGHVTLVGVLGEDEAGDSVRRLSTEASIQTELIADPSLHTTLKMRVLGRQQQLLRVDFEQHPAQAALDNVDAAFARHLANHDIVVLSDYAKGVLARVESLIALARSAGVPVLVDPKGHDYTRYRGATLVTPNRSEMQEAVGRWNSEAELTSRAQRLRADLDLEALLVTRSEQGMTLFTDAGRDHIDAQAHEVFDVSGAGDTVLATLAVSRAIDLPWVDAMGWANKAGGIAVGKLGTSIVTAAELAGVSS
ncbi:D-glycero-beta-D-manno-heptose-7-phosphate kinase [Achromobacter insolitus]|jgi:rfaE bifunctional protein kinase chain/domain|uniref:D-glycero-beta-D-manno-heptose-7-phosphate kinase n=1 Tax=Achromobacter TaxID=222 RepID=UPI0007C29E41|nr:MULTISPECIES: D-glycero-beta-D-manno-heptose-7-phosphate kinase [Achromobacter]GLK97660.1 D-beta-D-heptose 7-phosphate kinase [Achromobacter xylosoxidans]AVG38058.1 D-glycero-beta-D-manno-heptose-7-phosphate kinase [Achromobacter insolitus]MCP1404831.1 rfaE bifunctional protein kinase chain/domain [Achromobacter insolitus]MDH3065957.1 D-glycero-beta-D-manno-heptose-7-phosphate kinase [Achromobacter insolitus]MDQ6215363.1 D-glycero-beta-D-manno-heptose-7-phosphate kinase [Achromobacter insol